MSIDAILKEVRRMSPAERELVRYALHDSDEADFPLTEEQQANLRVRLSEPDDSQTISREEFIAKYLPNRART